MSKLGQPELPNDASARLRALDQRHHLHPWTHFESHASEGSMVLDTGEGAKLTDANGKSYLDAVGGMWCTNIGLGREEMAKAIGDQVLKLAYSSSFVDMTNGPAAELAAKLAELAPGDLNHVHFTTGGSTAVDSAYRMVGFYHSCIGKPAKTQIIARHQSYHGSTYVAMSIGNRADDRAPEMVFEDETRGFHHLSAPYPYRSHEGLEGTAFTDFLVAEFEDRIAQIGADKIGAFFAEPVMGSGGVIVPPEGYIKRMWEVCQKHDILYISDEVVTAFGRLGHWFASESEFGIVPDMICSAKGISSGYLPMGALIFSDRMYDAMADDPDRWFTSGYTYSGHPVCCAAALKNIEIIEREGLLENAATVGAYFEEQLNGLRDLEIVGDVRGKKMMMCVENVRNKATKELFDYDVNIGKQIANKAEEYGLIVRPIGHLNVMSPPLTLTKADVDFLVSTLRRAIVEVTQDLKSQGVL